MNLECLNDIIDNRLAIHIDVSDINSWNLNSGYTSISLNKWSGAKSDNIYLYDFGLTAYDNGRVNDMKADLTLTPDDVKLNLHRVGYNDVTGGTFYDLYSMSGVTTGSSVGNYFELDGGYLQGFFKLQEENYEILPARFGEGITIENILRIDDDSSGIFYLMGTRAEDKYNPFFSGETKLIVNKSVTSEKTGVVGRYRTISINTTEFSGVTTSKDHYLNAYLDEDVRRNAFADFQDAFESRPIEQSKDTTFDNVIAFELTDDKRIQIKRVNTDGVLEIKTSSNTITPNPSGWTIISQVFKPDNIILDPNELKCADTRIGTLTFYVNGRKFWELKDYREYIFVDIKNDGEKTYGVSYNISWGGGSFGLKHSWHYDLETYQLYSGESTQYINNNFEVTINPLEDNVCGDDVIITGSTGNSLTLLANDTTFTIEDECNPNIDIPITVMEATYSGATGSSLNQYFIKLIEPIQLISNRDYDFSVNIYDTGIFYDVWNNLDVNNKISLIVYGTTDVSVIEETKYQNPIGVKEVVENAPFPTSDDFEYLSDSNLLIDGETGYPVDGDGNIIYGLIPGIANTVTGLDQWNELKLKIETEPNTAEETFYVGILLESTAPINENGQLFIEDFKYVGSDILNQDLTKSNLLTEQNFDSSYKGGIQKLRIYDIAFNSQEVLHNAKIEGKNTPSYGFVIKGGGRIIYS